MNHLHSGEPCPHCGRYSNRPIAAIGIIIRNGKILLILRGKDPGRGQWAIPGGHIDFDETAETAVRREVKEETGLTVTQEKFFGLYSQPDRNPKQVIGLAYLIEVDNQEPKAGDDASDVRWFSLDALPENLAFDHQLIIHQAKAAKR